MRGRLAETLPELRLDAFLERLSSPAPTPGGGSASALAGATAAALLHMVLALTGGRPGAPDDDTLSALRGEAASGQSELLRLVQLDATAYDAVVTARRLPRTTELEAESRRVQVGSATREATRVPLEIVRRGARVLELAERVAAIGNRNAISDVGVAALLAAAATRGAALNVRVNLPYLPADDPLRQEAATELDRLLAPVEARERAVRSVIEERLS
jgi:formiminotetrahydrofolate cyclodeaminase